jgi:hypothetical protein
MSAPMVYVEIVRFAQAGAPGTAERVVHRMGPHDPQKADEIEDLIDHYIDHEREFTRQVPA